MTTGPDYPGETAAPADAATQAIRNLAAAAGWMRFMAILGFIGIALMGVLGLSVLAVGVPGGGPGARLLGVLYLGMAVVYLLPIVPLQRSADAAMALRAAPSLEGTASALSHLAVFWRRVGILTIVGLLLALVSFTIGFMVGPAAG